MSLSTKGLIREFIESKIAKKKEEMQVSDSDNVIAAGIIDSLGVMQLVGFIEDRFSLNIKDEDIIPENFESIESITSFIERIDR